MNSQSSVKRIDSSRRTEDAYFETNDNSANHSRAANRHKADKTDHKSSLEKFITLLVTRLPRENAHWELLNSYFISINGETSASFQTLLAKAKARTSAFVGDYNRPISAKDILTEICGTDNFLNEMLSTAISNYQSNVKVNTDSIDSSVRLIQLIDSEFNEISDVEQGNLPNHSESWVASHVEKSMTNKSSKGYPILSATLAYRGYSPIKLSRNGIDRYSDSKLQSESSIYLQVASNNLSEQRCFNIFAFLVNFSQQQLETVLPVPVRMIRSKSSNIVYEYESPPCVSFDSLNSKRLCDFLLKEHSALVLWCSAMESTLRTLQSMKSPAFLLQELTIDDVYITNAGRLLVGNLCIEEARQSKTMKREGSTIANELIALFQLVLSNALLLSRVVTINFENRPERLFSIQLGSVLTLRFPLPPGWCDMVVTAYDSLGKHLYNNSKSRGSNQQSTKSEMAVVINGNISHAHFDFSSCTNGTFIVNIHAIRVGSLNISVRVKSVLSSDYKELLIPILLDDPFMRNQPSVQILELISLLETDYTLARRDKKDFLRALIFKWSYNEPGIIDRAKTIWLDFADKD